MTGAILVTGAGSGIGRKITERLAHDGHYVYAGVRKESDLQVLESIKNVRPVRLDVTVSRDIAAALETIANGGLGLYGLVNNAGIATFGSVVDGDDTEFDLSMAVNISGPYRVTKAFSGLIMKARGRIVMIGSIAGILADSNLSAYSMSKHAIEALTDCLAAEMESHGVKVSVVEPGIFNTALANNARKRMCGPSGLNDLSGYAEPDDVAEAVAQALFDEQPKRRYLVASCEREARLTIVKQIAQLVQLNEGHSYTYDSNELRTMLGVALARSRSRIE